MDGRGEGLVRHSLMLLAWSQVANAANLLFHVVLGRLLPSEAYGEMVALLNIVLAFMIPMEALRTAVAHAIARAAAGAPGVDVRGMLRRWLLLASVWATGLVVVGLAASETLAAGYNLDTHGPLVLAVLAIGVHLVLPIVIGALQGLQWFPWMSAVQQGFGIIRLAAGWVLCAWVLPTASGGLAAQLLAAALALGLGLAALQRRLPPARTDGRPAPPPLRGYLARALLLLGGFAVLFNADAILVQFFLPDAIAPFAQAAIFAHIIVFLPIPVALVSFPKLVGRKADGRRALLLRALVLTLALIGTALAAFTLAPDWGVRLIYGGRALAPPGLVRGMLWALAPLGVTFLFLNYEMAMNRFRLTLPVLLLAAAYLGGVALDHRSVYDVMRVLGVVSTLSAAVSAAPFVFECLGARPRRTGGTTPATSGRDTD